MEQVEASITFSSASGSITPILMILHQESLVRIGWLLPPEPLKFFVIKEGLHPKVVVHSQGLELLGQGEVSEDHIMDLSRNKLVFIKGRPNLF